MSIEKITKRIGKVTLPPELERKIAQEQMEERTKAVEAILAKTEQPDAENKDKKEVDAQISKTITTKVVTGMTMGPDDRDLIRNSVGLYTTRDGRMFEATELEKRGYLILFGRAFFPGTTVETVNLVPVGTVKKWSWHGIPVFVDEAGRTFTKEQIARVAGTKRTTVEKVVQSITSLFKRGAK